MAAMLLHLHRFARFGCKLSANYLQTIRTMATARLYLDTRTKRKDNTYPLKISIAHHGRSALLSLGVYLHRDQWDAERQRIIGNDKQFWQDYADTRLLAVRKAMAQAKETGALAGLTISEVRDWVLRHSDPERMHEAEHKNFAVWYAHILDNHHNARTHDIYLQTWRRICEFEKERSRDALLLSFDDISRDWLDTFFLWLARRSPSVNARNIHLRNIRSVFNSAIDEGLTQHYPFRKYKIRPVATAKRNLTPAQLRTLAAMQVEEWQRKYRDAFLLSFYLVGINIGDLCTLRPDNLQHGRIVYHRAKTNKLYSIKVEAEAQRIIDQYRGTARLLSFAEQCHRHPYRAFAMRCNKELRKMLPSLTTYWARHSWATIAASLDIPDDTIALALGHSARNATTAIYIERDLRKVDAANRRVLDYVFNNDK